MLDSMLLPVNSDEWLFQRLAGLEARAAALEGQPDPLITPFLHDPAGTTMTTTYTAHYAGGKLWIAAAGTVFVASGYEAIGDVYDLTLSLTSPSGAYSAAGKATSGEMWVAPFKVWEAPASLAGSDTITLTSVTTNNIASLAAAHGYSPGPTVQMRMQGFIIELPY